MDLTVSRPFDPDYELTEAEKFKDLATTFEHPETMGLSERFSMLASLSEEKARILRELDEAPIFRERQQPDGQASKWPD
jgi:hypothetical protein